MSAAAVVRGGEQKDQETPQPIEAAGAKKGRRQPAQPQRRVPIRTCVACRTSGGKRTLIRVVRLPEGAGVVVDGTGKQSGRGAYVCLTPECVTLALKQKKLERSLKTPIPEAVADALLRALPPPGETPQA